ncbi:NAD(P)-binding protein [Thozetella sp. PMI_491]|nr:NAD(P)-binding protein [Thozetella sp. PMI_491]
MSVRVAVLGASGETGCSIVNGMLESPTDFEITSLTRPASINSPANAKLKDRGVKIVGVDLKGPEDAVAELLQGIDIVISAVNWQGLGDQIPLANASKKAGVKRFIPCNFATVCPPRGVIPIREEKERIIDHIKTLYLPYTVIEVGWWFQLHIPSVPSGRTEKAIMIPGNTIAGSGDVPWALTDLRDIGPSVARIIVDDRTLNRRVFVYGDLLSQNQSIAAMEKVTGEKIETSHITEEEIRQALLGVEEGPNAVLQAIGLYYWLTQGIRGDNTPEAARYLGYLFARELYPDLKYRSLESFYQEILDGKIERVFMDVLEKRN